MAKAVFILTVFGILLSEDWLVLWLSQRGKRNKRVKASVKNRKNIGNFLIYFEKWFTYGLRRSWIFFNSFWFGFVWSFSKNNKEILANCWNCLKSDWITRLGGFEWVVRFFELFNYFSATKIKKLDFWDTNNYTNFKHQ